MEIKELSIEGERVFVKKSNIFGWGFVKPYKIDGKLNWKNLLIGGSWFNLFKLVIILIIIFGVTQEYSNAIEIANNCNNNFPKIILP